MDREGTTPRLSEVQLQDLRVCLGSAQRVLLLTQSAYLRSMTILLLLQGAGYPRAYTARAKDVAFALIVRSVLSSHRSTATRTHNLHY